MNSDILKGKWNQIKGNIKQQWGNLTDNDVARIEGNYDEFVGILQERYGYTRERAEREVEDYLGRQRV
ncbi:MAG: CsbD family protein [Caldilineaceae bacterium]|nr:CsbD family protein [Caldilineaceae bacterium]